MPARLRYVIPCTYRQVKGRMSNNLKIVIGAGALFLVGLLVGFVLGSTGKWEAREALKQCKQQATEADNALEEERQECKQETQKAHVSKQLLLTKVELLRAVGELYANNYGLTSQHLARARRSIKSASKGLSKKHTKVTDELFEKIGAAQTLAMRLDPMARVHIEQILAQLQKLPGAR